MIQKSNVTKWRPQNKNQKRLVFPTSGDSGYYQNAGRKHYAFINNRSNQYLYNPYSVLETYQHQYPQSREQLSKVQKRNNTNSSMAQFSPKLDKIYSKNKNEYAQQDSLVAYQKKYENMRNQRQKQKDYRNQNSYNYMPRMQQSIYEPTAVKNQLEHQKMSDRKLNNKIISNYSIDIKPQDININSNKNTKQKPQRQIRQPPIQKNTHKSIQKHHSSNIFNYDMNPEVDNKLKKINKSRQSQSHLRLFNTVEDIYGIVHNSDHVKLENSLMNQYQSEQLYKNGIPYYLYTNVYRNKQPSKGSSSRVRMVNPTFISSSLQGA